MINENDIRKAYEEYKERKLFSEPSPLSIEPLGFESKRKNESLSKILERKFLAIPKWVLWVIKFAVSLIRF